MRLKSKSAESSTRARPGPTTEITIASTWSRIRFSNAIWRSSALISPEASSPAPSASNWPVSSTIDTRCGLRPLTAEATRWRMARICCGSSVPRTFTTIEADGSTLSRENSGRSGMHEMHPRGLHAVDARGWCGTSSPSSARKWLMFWTKAGGAERVGFVENLVADAAALGQAALGELHAQPGDPILRHHDDGAVVAQFVGHGLAFELLDDRGGVLEGEIGEERGHLRRRDPHDEEAEEADQRDGNGEHRGDARSAQRLHELEQTLH